ncbi:hypothetical protein [Tenacibaculum ovolyticum]|uniref:hypothetical protein n=1 Tax=Tenacibaculum ovolyticum TaxID=104270 RepID=UPI00048D67DE|nr:hypothetical protein [Tenacibaculum ovolyticum]
MSAKNPITYAARQELIKEQIDILLKDDTNNIYSVYQAKVYISERILFVEPRSIDRMLLPYNQLAEKEVKPLIPTNQLELFS